MNEKRLTRVEKLVADGDVDNGELIGELTSEIRLLRVRSAPS